MRLKLPNPLRRRRLPKELLERGEVKLMHLSDTPDNIYSFIFNLLEKVEPEYIIHTGDLVDNIKLERKPELRQRYENSLKAFLEILENSDAKVYVVPGNEDDVEVLRKLAKRTRILKPGSILEIEGLRLAVSHTPIELLDINNVDLKLYGHNFKIIPKGLNGLLNVNFILFPSKRIVKVKYPDGTNFERGYKLMRGL